jgi:hypothetical protein
MKASAYGIKNLQWMLPKLEQWLNEDAENYQNLTDIYNEVLSQYSRYMGHVMTNVGGIFTDYKTTDQAGAVYTVVPKAQQKEAVSFLQKQLFETPHWLLNKTILSKTTAPTSDRISSLQDQILGSLLNNNRLQRMVSSANREDHTYRIDEYMSDLKKAIWSEIPARKPIDAYRRNLQKSFVERLGLIVAPASTSGAMGGIVISFGPPPTDPKKSDVYSVSKGTLRKLKAEINAAIPAYADEMSKMHLQDLSERIGKMLDPK